MKAFIEEMFRDLLAIIGQGHGPRAVTDVISRMQERYWIVPGDEYDFAKARRRLELLTAMISEMPGSSWSDTDDLRELRCDLSLTSAVFHRYGIGGPKDTGKARDHLLEAEQQHSSLYPIAAWELAGITELTDHPDLSVGQPAGDSADEWYRKALPGIKRWARDGDYVAQHLLARMYLDGKGMTHNSRAGEMWLRRAAHADPWFDIPFILAVEYEAGDEIRKDETEAEYWYGVAVARGLPVEEGD